VGVCAAVAGGVLMMIYSRRVGWCGRGEGEGVRRGLAGREQEEMGGLGNWAGMGELRESGRRGEQLGVGRGVRRWGGEIEAGESTAVPPPSYHFDSDIAFLRQRRV